MKKRTTIVVLVLTLLGIVAGVEWKHSVKASRSTVAEKDLGGSPGDMGRPNRSGIDLTEFQSFGKSPDLQKNLGPYANLFAKICGKNGSYKMTF